MVADWFHRIACCAFAAMLMVAPLANAAETAAERDYKRSQTLWIELAERGDPRAQSSLGFLYLIGLWLEQNDRAALTWFDAAAKKGVPEAQYYLGTMFLKGRGVGRDLSSAYVWCELAASRGLSDELQAAHSCREEAARALSADEQRRADEQVRAWRERLPDPRSLPVTAQ